MADWLTTAQVAQLPGVTRTSRTIAEHCRKGLVPAMRQAITGRWLIRRHVALERYAPSLAAAEERRLIDAR